MSDRRYKGVAFDFDHTLYDRRETYRNLIEAFRREFADCLDPKYFGDDEVEDRAKDEVFIDALLHADYQGIYKGSWRGILQSMNETGLFIKDPGIERLTVFNDAYYPGAIVVSHDVAGTAAWLRQNGYVTGIITNGPLAYQRSKVEAVGCAALFDHVLVSIESGAEKPDPAPFRHMAQLMGIGVGELVYVGDDPRNDIHGGRNAGCTPVWFRSVNIWLDEFEPPVYAIDAIGDIRGLLEGVLK